MNDKIYPSMVIRSQAEAIELLEKENKELQEKAELGEHYKHLYSEVKKQKDDVVEAIKGILEINNNYNTEKLAPFYSRKWVEDTQTNLLRMLGEIE